MSRTRPRSPVVSSELVPRTPAITESLLRRALLVIACILVMGSLVAQAMLRAGAGDPDPERLAAFSYLFARHEPVHFVVLLGFSLMLLVALFGKWTVPRPTRLDPRFLPDWRAVALLALAVAAVCALGARFVLHSYPLAVDEFAADFQARLFAAGQATAPIAKEWLPFVDALTPVFIGLDAHGDSWTSAYLPVGAAIRAVFVRAGVPDLTNPVLAGLTIPVVWLVARRLWPSRPITAWVPTLLLAASPQFLFNSMTAYAMPAHLLLNMTWLYLYLFGTRAALLVAPVVGVLAMGLHQPNVHALFVAPFLLRLLLTRRWGTTAYFAAVYLFGAALWLAWWLRFYPSFSGVAEMVYSLPGSIQLLIQPMNLALLVSWQPIAMSLLALAALFQWRSMSSPIRDLALGLLLTLGFYLFVNFDQGRGWGYRYAYPVLGNLVLLAGQGWRILDDEWRRTRGPALLASSMLVALAIQVPMRAVQIESFTRPFADSMAFIRSLPVDVALIQQLDAWYARDLVRNDPWLTNRPKVMFEHELADEQIAELQAMGGVRRVEAAELERMGMIVRRAPTP